MHGIQYLLALLVLVPVCGKIRHVTLRQFVMLFASYLFYASWASIFALPILVTSTLFNYYWGAQLRRNPSAGRLCIGVVCNIAFLSFYKYVPAFAQSYHFPLAQSWAHLALPVGISFWTFQGLSYLFDQYREEDLDPTLLEFALYMAFAPTVLSGPICRLPEMLPQFRMAGRLDWKDIRYGAQRIWLGMLMTSSALILANGFHKDKGLDAAFASANLSAIDCWLLAFGYGLQLFLDFAGYTHIVIGIARLFGVRLVENFNRPFLSSTISEFWTRWHISLSFWIRDYLFLPLARVRRETWWRHVALFCSMVVFGIWHKGTVLFLIWGAYHGTLLVLHRLWQQTSRNSGLDWSGKMADAASTMMTIAAVSAGWLFFRANTLREGWAMFAKLFTPSAYGSHLFPTELYLVVVIFAGICLLSWVMSGTNDVERPVLDWVPMEMRFVCYAIACYLTLFRTAVPQGFAYTQF